MFLCGSKNDWSFQNETACFQNEINLPFWHDCHFLLLVPKALSRLVFKFFYERFGPW